MPDIPESIALAQPVLYLFIFYTIVIVGVFVGLMKWVVDKFIAALALFGDQIMGKLDKIDDKIDGIRPERKRGW